MPDVDILAVFAATIAAFALGGAYYALFGEQLAAVSDAAAAAEQPAPWEIAVELLRCLIIAAVVAGIRARRSSHGRSCSQPHSSIPTSRRLPPYAVADE